MLNRSRSSSLARFAALLLVLLLSGSVSAGRRGASDGEGPLAFVRDKFATLDNRGKFIAGAAAGFVGSRIAVGSAMTVVKVGAVAFVTAEVLDYCGVLDYHDMIEDHFDTITKVKDVCMLQADRFRKTVRNAVNPIKIQAFMDKERMASLGLASGCLVGIAL